MAELGWHLGWQACTAPRPAMRWRRGALLRRLLCQLCPLTRPLPGHPSRNRFLICCRPSPSPAATRGWRLRARRTWCPSRCAPVGGMHAGRGGRGVWVRRGGVERKARTVPIQVRGRAHDCTAARPASVKVRVRPRLAPACTRGAPCQLVPTIWSHVKKLKELGGKGAAVACADACARTSPPPNCPSSRPAPRLSTNPHERRWSWAARTPPPRAPAAHLLR